MRRLLLYPLLLLLAFACPACCRYPLPSMRPLSLARAVRSERIQAGFYRPTPRPNGARR